MTPQFTRLTYLQIIKGRLPYLALWGAGLSSFLAWPHVWAAASNKAHNCPKINWSHL